MWLSFWSAAASCGGTAFIDTGTDTSTNWLKSCESESECDPGSSCSCGRCTLECAADADCGIFSSDAVCVATSGRCAEERLCMPRSAPRGTVSSASSASCTHPASDYITSDPAQCFGRELPECPPGGEAFMDGCGCGCSAAPDYPRRCREQCELAGNCVELRFEEFPNYDATLQEWTARLDLAGLAAGQCSGDRRFIYTNNGTTREARIFTATGAFLSLSTGTDDVEEVCWGEGYWPEPVRCEMATVTELINPGLEIREVGQTVSLPWGEGPPEPLF